VLKDTKLSEPEVAPPPLPTSLYAVVLICTSTNKCLHSKPQHSNLC